jgi:hypothetical protein
MSELRRTFAYREITELIYSSMQSGGRLPSEPVLCKKLGVARVTLRAALCELQKEGIISRSRAHGTIVNPPVAARQKILLITSNLKKAPIHNPDIYLTPGVLFRCRELKLDCEHLPLEMIPEDLQLDRNCLGVIFSGRYNGTERLIQILKNIPVYAVNVLGWQTFDDFPAVVVPTYQAWFDGLKHLQRRGHRRIAFIFFKSWQMVEGRMKFDKKNYCPVIFEKIK